MKKALFVLFLVLVLLPGVFASGSKDTTVEGAGNPGRATEMKTASGIPGFAFADHIISKVNNGEALDIRVIHQDVSLEFSQVIGAGVKAAGEDLGINAEFTGSTAEHDIEAMVAVIETLIARKVDGLAIANVSAEALNPMIAKAMAAGIPTITYGTPAPGSKDLAFIGQDLVASGEAQGDLIAQALGEKGDVLIFSCAVSAQWSLDREKGVRAAIAKYPGMKVVNILETGTEDQQVYAVIENALRANPNLKGIASLCAVSTPVTGRVIGRLGLDEKLVHVGHDLETETLTNIQAGSTNAALSQDPYRQGYESVKMLYDFIMTGKKPQNLDTGVMKVDGANVEEYLKKLKDGEPIG